jgi:hypothetical protein
MTKTTKSKAKYRHAHKHTQRHADETKIGTIDHKYKTSSILYVYTFEKINKAFFDKKQVHNFPFGLIKVDSIK